MKEKGMHFLMSEQLCDRLENVASIFGDVSDTKKKARADEIAQKLGDNRHWHSHGRMIGIKELESMKIKIDDFGKNSQMKGAIMDYFSLVTSYMRDFKLHGIVQLRDNFESY